MDSIDKQQLKQLIAFVDKIFWEEWDPIGINDNPEARDEYSTYAAKFAEMLLKKSEKQRLLEYMFYVEHILMELHDEKDRDSITKRNALIVDKICHINDELFQQKLIK